MITARTTVATLPAMALSLLLAACGVDGTSAADAGTETDSGIDHDSGVSADTGVAPDAGIVAPDDISADVAALVTQRGLIALGAAVVDERGAIAVGASGLRSRTATVPVTAQDRWHLGSDTKAMTGVLAAILVERGVIGWDTTVVDAFPGFASRIDPAFANVTMVHLLTHRAGLSGAVPGPIWAELWRNEGAIETQRLVFAESILTSAPTSTPGTVYEYSNSGFIIAGAMLEQATGDTWEALMRREVFEPLGMMGCGFGPAATEGTLDAPLGHTDANPPQPVPAGPMADNPPALGPAGTVHCPLEDWAKFIAVHLRRGEGETPLLPASAFARLHADPGIGTPPSGFGYGYGWIVVDRDWAGGLTLTHAGSNTMNYAVAWVAPLKKRGYLVVANHAGDGTVAAMDEMVGALLQAYPGN